MGSPENTILLIAERSNYNLRSHLVVNKIPAFIIRYVTIRANKAAYSLFDRVLNNISIKTREITVCPPMDILNRLK